MRAMRLQTLGALILGLLVTGLLLAAVRPPESRAAAEEGRRLAVLFFGAPTANGPHHDPISRYRVLKKGLGVEGIDLHYSEDPAEAFEPSFLGHFDAVLMYGNWEQNGRMPPAQLDALLDYVAQGGGFVPVHCASACFGESPEFVKLVGARFRSHGGEEFEVRNVAPQHPVLKGLPGYKAWDETYVHSDHGGDREILQVREREPWTWTRRHGEGRVFYTAGGHDHRVWDLPEFQALLRNGILWAVGDSKRALLEALELPELSQFQVSLPGYKARREITTAQEPLEPAESLKLAQVPPGFELSLFAHEPDIVNPIHIAWDDRGRAFVIETIDYPNNLQAGNLGHDRITICEDTDGDGKADRFTRFAEELSIPTSLTFAHGGVVCTNGSTILFLKDTDGDDRADVRKVLIDGFSMGDTHAGISNLRYAPDGWIYATIGYSGFRGEVGGERHQFAQGVLRFRPNGSELEFLQNTTNNTWGLGFTEEFDVVGSTANGNPSFYLTFPRTAYEAAGMQQGRTPRADDNPLFFPMSMDIRQVDQFDRYTAGAGHALYTARRFPKEYQNRVAFVCEPTGKLVGSFDLQRRGAGFRAEQSPNNLYASADAWSGPVCAEVGPDGAVWVCDWYNLIIQHNPTPSRRSAGVDAETGKGNAYETPLRDKQHGRIYRIYPKGSPDDRTPRLDPKDPASLLAALGHDNMFWRLHAQRLLIEAGTPDQETGGELAALVAKATTASPYALRILAALGPLDPELLQTALRSSDPTTRRAGIAQATPNDLKLAYVKAGRIQADGRELAEVLVGLSQAASDPEIGAAVYTVAADLGDDLFDEPALADAWQMAARRQRAGVLATARAAGVEIGAPSESENLLANPGFEEVAGGKPVGWTDLRIYSGAGADEVRVASARGGRGGGRCLEIQSDKVSDCGIAMPVRLERGTRYRLSGWIKTDGVRPARGPGAMMNVHGGSVTRGVRDTTDWTEVSVEFEAERSGPSIIHCLFGGYGGARGRAFWDDVALVAIGGGASVGGALQTLAQMAPEQATAVEEPASREFAIDEAVHERGAQVFTMTCIACHGVDGGGVPSVFPPIDGSDWLTGAPELPIRIVLHGLMGPVKVKDETFNNVMAPLGPLLNDQQIADVLTYVRQSWSNDAAPVTPDQVKAVRAATADRKTMYSATELGR